jgi:hypothetical protein
LFFLVELDIYQIKAPWLRDNDGKKYWCFLEYDVVTFSIDRGFVMGTLWWKKSSVFV